MPKKITKETTLKEILELAGAEKILLKYHLPCLGCPMARFEMAKLKIGNIAKMYGIDLENLFKELNTKVAPRANRGRTSEVRPL